MEGACSFDSREIPKPAKLRVGHGSQRALGQALLRTGGTSSGPGSKAHSTWTHKVERRLWSTGEEVHFEKRLGKGHPVLFSFSDSQYKTLTEWLLSRDHLI